MRLLALTVITINLLLANNFAIASCSQADLASSGGWDVAFIKTTPSPSESKNLFFQASSRGTIYRLSSLKSLSSGETQDFDMLSSRVTVNDDCSVEISLYKPVTQVGFNSYTDPVSLVADGPLNKGKDTIMGTYYIYRGNNQSEMGTFIAMKSAV